jgi:hypothetical protein
MNALSRIPPPIMRASTNNFTLGHLILRHEKVPEKGFYKNDDATEWLLGHRMPPFQRPALWTLEQQVRFLTSCWSGIHLGTYVVNRVDNWRDNFLPHVDNWLIDGQQRLRAIKAYLEDEFSVYGYRWSELTKIEQRHFDNIPFACSMVHETSESNLRMLYDLLNFGGTPHTEDQRATLPVA